MSKSYEPRHYTELVVVDQDRYHGSYSGAAYTAWWGIPPDDIDAGDMSCDEFWADNKDVLCGKGRTAQEAFKDLFKKVDAAGWLIEPKFVDAPTGEGYGQTFGMLFNSPEFLTWLNK